MTTSVALCDIKDTDKFCALINREHEVIVTKDGSNIFRCTREARETNETSKTEEASGAVKTNNINKMNETNIDISPKKRLELKNQMQLAMDQIKEGKYMPAKDFLETL